jgi:hypothetical protein
MGSAAVEERDHPKRIGGQMMHHKMKPNVNHMSIIACSSTAGEIMIRYIVTSQNSPAVREQLRKRDVQFILRERGIPSINTELFTECICTVFLPDLNERPNLEAFAGQVAI